MSWQSWRKIGKALGDAQHLISFTCQACNLYQGDNMYNLVSNMHSNTSIETLDFSDNELTDKHGEYIATLIKAQSEQRDNQIWQMSLR